MALRFASYTGRTLFLTSSLALVIFSAGCAGTSANTVFSGSNAGTSEANAAAPAEPKGATITIAPNSPADTVRAFYEKLKENRIREAIYLTNLRPAIEGLSDDELREFSVDFARIANRVPSVIQINGEIITGDNATVTANLPNEDDELELQQLKLRRQGENWVILSVDPIAEARIKKEGKNYLRELKIDSHQEDAKEMLERIAKAQMVYSIQNQGKFGQVAALIDAGFLPDDVKSSASTGYVYTIHLGKENASYYATAEPAEYGRTGRNSYILKPQDKGMPVVTGRDNGGKQLELMR